MAEPQPRQSLLLRHGLAMPEVLYPWDQGRFTFGGCPPIMNAMIPHLDCNDPDDLFDRLGLAMRANPTVPMPDHLRIMFRWLQSETNTAAWVERSGGSLRIAHRLIAAFPEAKIVHLVRDGRDTALSMSRHIGFRMALLCGLQTETLGVDPFETGDRTDEADLTDELAGLLPENFSRQSFDEFDLPASLCAHYWSGEIVQGLNVLASVHPEHLLTIRYEDLLRTPERIIESLGNFADVEIADDWVRRAADLVRPQPPRWNQLPPDELIALESACAPGTDALARFAERSREQSLSLACKTPTGSRN